jgi:outer membrane receptor protein involved in Fe transport
MSDARPAEHAGMDGELEEVIVTAQKRSEKVQDVPASISVLSGRQLENLHATSMQDYAAYVPGLIVSSGGSPGQTQITLRGLNPLNAGATMVATVLDDVPIGSSNGWANESSLSFDMMPYDLERVEVLRGPQGTLYGANSMGGLIKYVTRGVNLNDLDVRVGGETFSIDAARKAGWAGRASINLPLVPGSLAIRASLYEQKTPGYIDNPLTGRADENALVQRGARVALTWQPTEALAVKVQAINQQIKSNNNAAVSRALGGQSPNPEAPDVLDPSRPPYYIGLQPLGGDLTHPHQVGEPFYKDISYFSGTLTWQLDWTDFTAVSSYAHTVTRVVSDDSHTFGEIFGSAAAFQANLGLKRFTQEARLASPSGGQFEWLVGSYYSYENSSNLQSVRALDENNVPIPGLDPVVTDSIPTFYREAAAFANVTYRINTALDVIAGLRWAKNIQTFREVINGESGAIFPNSMTQAQSAQGVFTWASSVRYHFTPNAMLYTRVATGYRPGGPNSTLGIAGIPSQVNADTTINYEAGIKSEFWNHRALVDLTVYRINWKSIQLATTLNNNSFSVNGGTALSQGVELAANYSPVTGLNVGFSAAYTDAKITETVPVTTVHWVDGAQLPTAPRWSGALTAAYDFPLPQLWHGRADLGYRYVGAQYTDVQSATYATRLSAYSALDLNAGATKGHWDVRLYVKNLTNKRAYTNQGVQTDSGGVPLYINSGVLQPRTMGLSLDVSL